MTTLKQTYWENCDKLIKCDFPCDSCFGCKNKLKEVKEWLQQKRQDRINKIVRAKKNILSIEERTIINSFYDELLEDLK